MEENARKENKLNATMKLLDPKLEVQIFNGPRMKELKNLVIKKIKQLGGGAQADVYQCAIKGVEGKFVDKTRFIYNNKDLADTTAKSMFREFMIAKDLIHPNIVEYKYFMKKYDPKTKNYECHIILEQCDGLDMDSYLKQYGPPLGIDTVRSIGAQILSSLAYLHNGNILHQDLKPQNIMLIKDFQVVKLIDMGVSSKLDSTRATLGAGAGTSRYMPPEQLNGRLSSKVDIWAFGCVMLQLITGNRPFHSIDNDIAATMQIFNKQNPLTFALKNSKA